MEASVQWIVIVYGWTDFEVRDGIVVDLISNFSRKRE